MLTAYATSAAPPPAITSTFVRKLYRILDKQYPGIISWNESGTVFSVFDLDRLEQQVLPLYFRGRRDAFHQQLREHGFESVHVTDAAESYRHADFVRGNPNKLSRIVRVQLPRRRTRRKKVVAATEVDDVKSEPMDWEEHELALLLAGQEPLAGNSIKFHDILPWPQEPAVDALPLSENDTAALSAVTAELSDEQLDTMVWLLVGGDGAGLVPPSCPITPMESSTEFSADMLHTLMEHFSTVPT